MRLTFHVLSHPFAGALSTLVGKAGRASRRVRGRWGCPAAEIAGGGALFSVLFFVTE